MATSVSAEGRDSLPMEVKLIRYLLRKAANKIVLALLVEKILLEGGEGGQLKNNLLLSFF